MLSQPITIQLTIQYNQLTNNYNTHVASISWSKGNRTMKFGQLVVYNKINVFLQKSCRKWDRLVPDLFLFFKKALWTQWKMYVMLAFEKTQKYFLNRMKHIEGSLMKSSGKISREHQKLLVWKK